MDEAEYCGRISIMHAGRLIELGTPHELVTKHNAANLEDMFIDLIRRYRITFSLGLLIVAAVLAPPDVITQIGLAVPLILLYEISIIAARFVEPKQEET